MEILSLLVAVSSGLVTMLKTFYDTHTERNDLREKTIQEYFERVADTMQRVVDDLNAGQVPHGACAEMYQYAEHLPAVLSPLLCFDSVQHYAHMLKYAHQVEQLYVTHNAGHLDLAELEKIIGTFRACAVLAFKARIVPENAE